MNPSDEFFPKDITPHVDEIVGMELRRQEQEMKVIGFYEALSRDPLATTLEYTKIIKGPLVAHLIDPLTRTIRMRGGTVLTGVKPDTSCSIIVSGIYDSYPYPEEPDVKIKSSVMRVSSGNHYETNFAALLLTARRKELDDNTPLSKEEINNSVPAILMPESNDGSFVAYAAGKEAGCFDIVSPAQTEDILNKDIQRYVDSVNSRSK